MTKEETTRFWEQVQVGTEDECWPWTGAVGRKFGEFNVGGKTKKVHRIAFELEHGDIGRERVVMLCQNPLCCNFRHMRRQWDFWAQVDKRGEDECWLWTGTVVGTYGMIACGPLKGKMAHRVVYEDVNGPLPEKCFVRRVCGEDLCCNPRHMVVEDCDFWSKVDKQDGDGCWFWTGCLMKFGYGNYSSGGKIVKAHRYSYEQAHGPIPEGLCVMHLCDVPNCVRPSHLMLGTLDDNNKDRTAKGRGARGETHSRARITEEDVREIRSHKRPNIQALADRYGLTKSGIGCIRSRRTWKHVQ